MRLISTEIICAEVRDLFLMTAFILPEKIRRRLASAAMTETTEPGQMILERLLENCELATSNFTPLCQDTGLAQVVLEIGQQVFFEGPPLIQAIETGVRQAYQVGFLRKSTCHPLTRQNLGDNCPPIIETIITSGDKVLIKTMAKGGGCDNKSRQIILKPTATMAEVRQSVVDLVIQAGSDACPPICLGLCLGGNFDSGPRLAKRALMDLFEDPPMTDEESDIAEALFEDINATGLGPMGLGGLNTVLGVRVKIAPCHIASLPVTLNINCHSLRTGQVLL
ncbi:MAG: fumarate hydratase [Deltaproteobacteria bacterium]|jgi:fumarate hydratase subunit alpha|nr:fumarate hydratase [Deltaproteobacteria bacterium]